MGDVIGGIVGGIGSIIGGQEAAAGEKQAAQQALTGYNYLKTNPLLGQLQTNAGTADTDEKNTVGSINSLLTSPNQNNPAYQNYLNSTGYQFQLQQGTDAITGNAASKGLLNSGATGKSLENYGQNLASTSFNNYLGQLSGVANLQANQVTQGQNAVNTIGQAGTTGGANEAQMTAAAAQSVGTSTANAFNQFGGAAANAGGSNFLGGSGGLNIPSSSLSNSTIAASLPSATVTGYVPSGAFSTPTLPSFT